MVVTAEATAAFVAIPIEGLVAEGALPFPLFVDGGNGRRVLYRDLQTSFDQSHVARLADEGVQRLWIRAEDRKHYLRRVEANLDLLLRNRSVPLDTRADVLHGVAVEIAEDLLDGQPTPAQVQRGRRAIASYCHLVLREPQALHAVRQVLQARPDLVGHSVSVSFLAIGLSRQVCGGDPSAMMRAGIAGLLHDVGRVGHPEGEDPEHTTRGQQLLRSLRVPEDVCEVALCHHERFDGSGFPRGLAGDAIPLLARIVGLVDTFDRVWVEQQPRVSVYDALRILGQVYRGCFDQDLACGLVRMFKATPGAAAGRASGTG